MPVLQLLSPAVFGLATPLILPMVVFSQSAQKLLTVTFRHSALNVINTRRMLELYLFVMAVLF